MNTNIEDLKMLAATSWPNKPLLAYVMRKSGLSYREIGEVLGVSRQTAKTMVDKHERNNQ